MQLVTLLPLNVLLAVALAQSVRWSLQFWRDNGVLHQIEALPARRLMDDLKMASAVTLAAVVMIPAILTYAFVSWLFRTSLLNLVLRGKPSVDVTVRSPFT